MGLIERDAQLATLTGLLEDAGDAGRLVLVGGEAGAGKSALVEHFVSTLAPPSRVLVGRCDDLFAPRPLGPIADIARAVGGPLAEALAAGDAGAAFDAFVSELSSPGGPVVVVLEDLQWADEATLDLVRAVARRLAALRTLILVTHRVEVAATHPLQRTLGSLVGPLVTRMTVSPLSEAAVRDLADGSGLDASALHARTGGNPFFVVELLAGGAGGGLPATVRDTILARAALLGGGARDALDAAAVLGRTFELETILDVGDCDAAAVDECVAIGLLTDDPVPAFRHDLAREAIEGALTPLRRRQLHARALDALAGRADLVQLAHHAIGAGDGARIVDLAGRAAARCVELGAYREAAALYGNALEHAGDQDPSRLRLLEGRARTCERVEQLDAAIAAGEALLAHPAVAVDDRKKASWESWLGGVLRVAGRGEEAWSLLEGAVRRLEGDGASFELAQALALLGQHQMVSSRSAEAVVTTRRALALAEELGLEEVAVHALDSLGTALACLGDETGIDRLREALDRAKRAGVHHEVTRSALNLTEALLVRHRPAETLDHFDVAIQLATERELRFNLNALLTDRALALFLLGRWDDAIDCAQRVLEQQDLSGATRSHALLRIGQVRARRGDGDPFELLDPSLALARPYAEMQVLIPVMVARTEAAWLAGDRDAAQREIASAIDFYVEHPEPWYAGAVAMWAARCGVDWRPPGVPEQFERMLDGDVRGAARRWDELGCVYEAADALAEGTDVVDLREALDRLTAMGARPRAQQVTRALRGLGVRDLPRGPRATTRRNPAGLTARELEVTSLLALGLTNSDIATRLVLSPKTVDHHVSSVLAKLHAPTRRDVAAAAASLGIDVGAPGADVGA